MLVIRDMTTIFELYNAQQIEEYQRMLNSLIYFELLKQLKNLGLYARILKKQTEGIQIKTYGENIQNSSKMMHLFV